MISLSREDLWSTSPNHFGRYRAAIAKAARINIAQCLLYGMDDPNPRSNPFCSTNQSLAYRVFQRIQENPRVCARFVFACGPRERRRRRKSPKFSESSLRAASLCPTPCDRRGWRPPSTRLPPGFAWPTRKGTPPFSCRHRSTTFGNSSEVAPATEE
jgi:hypothetical protein